MDKRTQPDLLSTIICTSPSSPHAIICLNGTKLDGYTFDFEKQDTVVYSARQLQDFHPLFGGGSAIFIHDTLRLYNPAQLCANVPPDTVAVKFDCALFCCEKQVVLVCSYLAPSTSDASKAYRNALGRTQLEALETHVVALPKHF